MTVQPRLDRDLAAWFDAETSAPPADLLSRTLVRVAEVGQRPGLLSRHRYAGPQGRRIGTGSPAPLALLLIVVVSGAVVGVANKRPDEPSIFLGATTGSWQPSGEVAFIARIDDADAPAFKWRAGVYSEYTGTGWSWGDTSRKSLAQGRPLADISPEADFLTPDARQRLEITIGPASFADATIVGPNVIESVDRPTDAIVIGTGRWFVSVEAQAKVDLYTVTALVPRFGGGIDAISEERLRSAGTEYPAEITSIYTALPERAVGPAASALLEDIRAQVRIPVGVDPTNPYDLARTIEAYLRSERFVYSEDVRSLVSETCPADISTVECFARIRQGYCEYYASTMAVLLRASGVPARIAYGFLPGERSADGAEVVNASAMHWWVEVYFPEIGWMEFDPTGGGRGVPLAIPSGG